MNIPNFKILSFTDAYTLVNNNPGKFTVISVEPVFIVKPSLCKHQLHLKMSDEIFQNTQPYDPNFPDYTPNITHITSAISFYNHYSVDIIHCKAGLSRSPAIAYAIFRSLGIDKNTALRNVFKLAPRCVPNKLVVKLTDQLFSP